MSIFEGLSSEQLASLEEREHFYEQLRKWHTVLFINYPPSADSRKDVLELTGPQVQLTFDMGYRLAMKQIQQYLEGVEHKTQDIKSDYLLEKLAKFSKERIEDSYCLNWFVNQKDDLSKNKENFESSIRDFIGCDKYE